MLIGINHKSESNDCLLDQVLNKVYLTNYYTIFSYFNAVMVFTAVLPHVVYFFSLNSHNLINIRYLAFLNNSNIHQNNIAIISNRNDDIMEVECRCSEKF